MTTPEALGQRMLLIETMMQEQVARYQTLTEQQTVQMASHQSMHEEVKKIVDKLASSYATGLPPGRVDKTLLPQRYSGDKT